MVGVLLPAGPRSKSRPVVSSDAHLAEQSTELVVPAIGTGEVYTPPDNGSSQLAVCECNTPLYSCVQLGYLDPNGGLTWITQNRLYSACAACQGAGWVKWSEWSAVCGVGLVGV